MTGLFGWALPPPKRKSASPLAIAGLRPHLARMTETFDNHVSIFQIDGSPVRGRAVQLSDALNDAIGTDRYPPVVARLLGEAMMICALVARALKFKGRLIVQCHGTNEGAVSLLTAHCTTEGDIRGYARFDAQKLKEIQLDNRKPGADVILGGGTFSMTIDQGADMDQYQGLAAIEGPSLAACAEHYFMQSEQIPTQIRLAVAQVQTPGKPETWRGSGVMIQRIAADDARGDTQDEWETAKALFKTLTDAEMVDPDLAQDDLLYRLFHESGVRIIDRAGVQANCTCSHERLLQTLKTFENDALADMADNGAITVNCEFCDSNYVFDLDDLSI